MILSMVQRFYTPNKIEDQHRRENIRDCDVIFDGMFENDCDEEMNEEYGD